MGCYVSLVVHLGGLLSIAIKYQMSAGFERGKKAAGVFSVKTETQLSLHFYFVENGGKHHNFT